MESGSSGWAMGGLFVLFESTRWTCLGEEKEREWVSVEHGAMEATVQWPGSCAQKWLERWVWNAGETSVLEVQIWESLAHKKNWNHGTGYEDNVWYKESQGQSSGKHQNLWGMCLKSLLMISLRRAQRVWMLRGVRKIPILFLGPVMCGTEGYKGSCLREQPGLWRAGGGGQW